MIIKHTEYKINKQYKHIMFVSNSIFRSIRTKQKGGLQNQINHYKIYRYIIFTKIKQLISR